MGCPSAAMVFQFPNGSIKRSMLKKEGDWYKSFNSLMVRLKAYPAMLLRVKQICFNSLMVRLKVSGVVKGLGALAEFQFPNGSIKRPRTPKKPSIWN